MKSQSPHEILHILSERMQRHIHKEICQTSMMEIFTKIVNLFGIAAHTRINELPKILKWLYDVLRTVSYIYHGALKRNIAKFVDSQLEDLMQSGLSYI